jgi:hypothetical protein
VFFEFIIEDYHGNSVKELKSRKLFFAGAPTKIIWQGWRDSNPQPSVLETAVLPIGTTPLLKG